MQMVFVQGTLSSPSHSCSKEHSAVPASGTAAATRIPFPAWLWRDEQVCSAEHSGWQHHWEVGSQSSTIWANVSALWSTLNLSMSEPVGDFPVVSELHEDE